MDLSFCNKLSPSIEKKHQKSGNNLILMKFSVFIYLFIRIYISTIFIDNLASPRTSNIDRSNLKNGFTLKKARSRQYPAETMTDIDYADDIALLANTPALSESLLHSLKQTTGDIGLLVTANKTE